MDSWAMMVQYICAAACAAAVVRWVDGCGKVQKRTALWVEPESGSVSRSARASYEQDNYTRAGRLMQGGKDCHEQKN